MWCDIVGRGRNEAPAETPPSAPPPPSVVTQGATADPTMRSSSKQQTTTTVAQQMVVASSLHSSSSQSDLSPKERDQLRLHQLQQRKLLRADKEQELLEFRHSQTIKRWAEGKQDVKPSKVVYLSDFVRQPHHAWVDAPPHATDAPPHVSRVVVHGDVSSGTMPRDPPHGPPPKSSVARALLGFSNPPLEEGDTRPPPRHPPRMGPPEEGKQGVSLLAHVGGGSGPIVATQHRHSSNAGSKAIASEESARLLKLQRMVFANTPHAARPSPTFFSEVSSTKRRVLKQRALPFRADHHPIPDAQQVQLDTMQSLVDSLETLLAERRRLVASGETAEAARVLRDLRRLKSKLSSMHLALNASDEAIVEPPPNSQESDRDPEVDEGDGEELVTAEITAALFTPHGDYDGDGNAPEDPPPATINAPPPSTQKMRRRSTNFYPTLIQLGVGLHPLATAIDCRTDETRKGISAAPAVGLVREYCVNLLTDDIDRHAASLLTKLQAAQKKLKAEQPLHYRARMRYQCGLREVIRSIVAKRVRLVLLAPDVEPVDGESGEAEGSMVAVPLTVAQTQPSRRGIEGTVRAIVDLCAAKGIPWACCLSRRGLGRALHMGRSQVSVVAILSADGAYEDYRNIVAAAREGLVGYRAMHPAPASSI